MTITLLLIIALLIISAFFSMAETGLTSASRAKIHKLKGEGNRRAAQVSKLREDKDRLIVIILLGNTLVNIAASALATSLALDLFGHNGVAYATFVMTFMVLTFTEVLPKTYALRNAEKVALGIAPIIILLIKIFSPAITFIQVIVRVSLRLFGLKHESDDMLGSDALRGAIELHHDEGTMIKGDRDMMGSILDLSDTEVGEVMLHRKEMKTIDIDTPPDEIVDFVLNSTHTRIPLWKDNPDNIIGLLHNKDIAKLLYRHDKIDSATIMSILSEPWFVPETTTLRDQLNAFREKQNHFALVVDEYGALLGLITLEDILEEIVGHINDEYDVGTNEIRKYPDDSYTVAGNVTIRDLNRELDWNLPDDNATTVAGLIIYEAQIIPEVKQEFHFHGCRFRILKKHNNQITSVRIRKLESVKSTN